LVGFLEHQQIARFKLRERLEVVASFPLTSVGKVSMKDPGEDIATKLQAATSAGA
jgi:2,3-dihydroxybenzoate-AMP ligase